MGSSPRRTSRRWKGAFGAQGSYFGVKGHIKFDDGTQAEFSSKLLDTAKVGNLKPGTVVPVRYNSDHEHVVLDVLKLEARKAPSKPK